MDWPTENTSVFARGVLEVHWMRAAAVCGMFLGDGHGNGSTEVD
jgi:hypothetical protein